MTASYTSPIQNQWRLDLSDDGSAWSQLLGVNGSDFPGVSPGVKDSSSYDNSGWGSSTTTSYKWALNINFFYSVAAGVTTPAVTLLQNAVGQFGDANQVFAQWYRIDGVTPVEGWSGKGIVDLQSGSTNWDDIRSGKLVLTGSGSATKLTTLPTNYTAPAPVVTAATPSGAAAGAQVQISGSGFTGATGVKFGAVAATSYVVVSDYLIVAIMPAGSAGAAAVTVTTAAGTSNALTYTRGA